jgi:hypothetical protein
MRARILSVLGAAGAVAALAAPMTGASAAPLPGTVTVNPSTPSALGDGLMPLAGSDQWLAFTESTQLVASNGDRSQRAPYFVDVPSSRRLMARSSNGDVESLGTAHASDVQWSLASNVLTATRRSGSHTVDWWNVATNTRGHVSLDHSKRYLTSAPGGMFIESPHHRLVWLHVKTGRTKRYGKVAAQTFGSTSGPAGAVLRMGKHWRYVRYSKPSKQVNLKVRSSEDNPATCTTADGGYVSCWRTYVDSDSLSPENDELVPLDGGAPTVSTTCPGIPAVGGRLLLWASTTLEGDRINNTGCAYNRPVLESISAGATSAISSGTAVTPGADWLPSVAWTDGHAVFAGENADSLLAIGPSGHAVTLYSAPKSPTSVGAIALSPGRITDTDDQPDPDHPSQPVLVRSRPLTSDGSTVDVGTPTVVSDEVEPRGEIVAASGSTTAYLADDPDNDRIDLRVTSLTRSVTVDDYVALDTLGDGLSVSGNRVLYDAGTDDTAFTPAVLDLRTGSTTQLPGGRADRASLWGDYFAYQTDSAVYLEDLATGTATTIDSLKPGNDLQLYGDHLADWTDVHRVDVYDIGTRTLSHVHVGVKHSGFGYHWRVSSAGIVFRDDKGFELTTWSGDTDFLVSADDVLSGETPQVDGQSVAWLTSAGDLQVAAIDVPLPQPRGLGDPIAPTTYAAGGSDTWSTSIPYSMPLTSCQVTISQGNTKVRTLDCDATQSARGVAAVSWDGRDQNGHVVADGSYTWTVTAAGSAGPALNAAGDAAPVTGTITAS